MSQGKQTNGKVMAETIFNMINQLVNNINAYALHIWICHEIENLYYHKYLAEDIRSIYYN